MSLGKKVFTIWGTMAFGYYVVIGLGSIVASTPVIDGDFAIDVCEALWEGEVSRNNQSSYRHLYSHSVEMMSGYRAVVHYDKVGSKERIPKAIACDVFLDGENLKYNIPNKGTLSFNEYPTVLNTTPAYVEGVSDPNKPYKDVDGYTRYAASPLCTRYAQNSKGWVSRFEDDEWTCLTSFGRDSAFSQTTVNTVVPKDDNFTGVWLSYSWKYDQNKQLRAFGLRCKDLEARTKLSTVWYRNDNRLVCSFGTPPIGYLKGYVKY